MPNKYKTKQLAEGTYYHAYNRGYNKQKIFLDNHDYNTFLYLLRKYLDPDFRETKYLPNGQPVQVAVKKPLYGKVELHAYCLMPNHFHLLIKQITKDGMPRLANVVNSQYTIYFNNKYGREGTIWQGTYRAVLVKTEEQYLHLSRYIHLNPLSLCKLEDYPYSSYPLFIGRKKKQKWLTSKDILHYFSSNSDRNGSSYRLFVEGFVASAREDREKEKEIIKDILLEY